MLKALRQSLKPLEHTEVDTAPTESPRYGPKEHAKRTPAQEINRFQVLNERLKGCRLGKQKGR